MKRSPNQSLLVRNKAFRRLWIAQTGSSLGDWFNQVALAQLTLVLTHSPSAMGCVLLCRSLPQVFVGTLIGPVIDRVSNRGTMLIADITQVWIVLMFIFADKVHSVGAIYVGAFLMGVASSFFIPARTSAITSIVGTDDLIRANTLTTGTSGVLAVVGALTGGIVSSVLSPDVAFIINACTFVWSTLWILNTRWNERLRYKDDKFVRSNYFHQLQAGLRAIAGNKILRLLLFTNVIFALSAGPYFVMIPVFGEMKYHLGGIGIGMLYVADGIAFVTAAWATARFSEGLKNARLWYSLGFVVEGVFFAAFALTRNVWTGMMTLFLSQLGSGILMTIGATLLQNHASESLRGRIFATSGASYNGASQLSLAISGPAMQFLGSPVLGTLVGIISLIAAIAWWVGYLPTDSCAASSPKQRWL